MKLVTRGCLVLLLIAAVAFFAAGCTRQAENDPKKEPKNRNAQAQAAKEKDKDGEEGAHGWWCAEHGIPEAECSMCQDSVKKACKAKGDWCDKHNRAKSQCFKCDPKLKEEFAAKYRAKYPGKEPPPITDDD